MENVKHFKAVLKGFDAEMKKMQKATTPQAVSDSERMLTKIVTEMQLVVPRFGEDVFAESRKRRNELLKGE